MATDALMEKAGERMYVPQQKVQSFLEDGWIVIVPASGSGPQAEPANDASVLPDEAAEKVAKPRRKKRDE